MTAYEEYKDSGVKWLGEIPSHWEVGNMRQFFTERKELSESGQEMLLSVSEYKGITPAVNESGENVSRSASLVGYKKCYVGDLIINIMLAWKRGLAVTSYDGFVSPAYCVFASHNIIPAYANYLLRTDTYVAEFKRNSTGIIDSRLRMYPDDFKNIKCIAPPREEQDAIVAYLDKVTGEIDRAIEIQQQMIDALNERIQIIISNAVTKGLNPDVPLRDSGIDWLGQIPAHWQLRKIKHLCSIFGRIGFRGYTEKDLVNEGEGAITLSPSNIQDGKMNYDKCSYLSWKKYYESPEIMISNGDIIFVKTGSSFGKCALVTNLPMEATINPQSIVMKNFKCSSLFLSYLLKSDMLQKQVNISVIGGTIPTISQEKIKNYYAAIPDIDEQNQIAEFIESATADLFKQIENCNRMIDLLTERKQIIINQVVTGKEKVI